MPRPTVFLFDVDGTILDARGAGRRAMEGAFAAVHPQHAEAMTRVRFAGMTDPGIIRLALEHAGLYADAQQVEAVLAAYLQRIESEVDAAPPRVIAGVQAAIEAAHGHARAVVGLGTGNHVQGARYKLAAVQLWDRFDFGGFGSDAEVRAEMLAIGRDRGLARLGAADARVVVIGDTPRDVQAATTIGAECLAVTTGPHDAAALAGADCVVDRLDRPESLDFLSG